MNVRDVDFEDLEGLLRAIVGAEAMITISECIKCKLNLSYML